MRSLGALIFGLLADRYGRRKPLMANVISSRSSNFATALLQTTPCSSSCALFMELAWEASGEWDPPLAMQSAPPRWRGVLSGIVQSGYSIGYLLAAVAARLILPVWGWRAMFWVGGIPALLALYIRSKVKESEAWKRHHAPTVAAIFQTVRDHRKLFGYLVLLITCMMFLSHGTQDLYPHFLQSVHAFPTSRVATIVIVYNIGAVFGAIFFGHLSESIGRRRSMLTALGLSLAVIPVWAFGRSLATLMVGAFLIQVGVQGARGIIPAHLNEMSPHAVRGRLPGFAYQLGILIAAPTNNLEYALRDRFGYSWALAGFDTVNIPLLAMIIALGKGKKGRSFLEHSDGLT